MGWFFLGVSNDSNVCMSVGFGLVLYATCYVMGVTGREIGRRKGGLRVRADTDRSVRVSELTCNRKCDFCMSDKGFFLSTV